MHIKLEVSTTEELKLAIESAITASGYKKTYIAERMGISNQNFNRFINKKHLSIDDANKILNIIGYESKILIAPVNKNQSKKV